MAMQRGLCFTPIVFLFLLGWVMAAAGPAAASPDPAAPGAASTAPAAVPAGHEGHDHSGAGHKGHPHANPAAVGGPPGPISQEEADLMRTLRTLETRQPKDAQERDTIFKEGERILRKLVKDFPSSPQHEDYAHGLARLLMGANRQGEAVAAWRDYMKDLKDKERVYRAHRFLADLLATTGAGREAAQVLQDYLKTYPDSDYRPHVLDALADRLAGNGEAIEAVKILEELLAKYPGSPLAPQVRLRLAKNMSLSGKAKEAIAMLEAMKADPKLADYAHNATLLIGYAQEEMGQTTAAVAEYQRMQASPIRAVALQGHFTEGELWHRLGDKDRAAGSFRKCLTLASPGEAYNQATARLATLELLGQKAPDFALRGLDGKPIASSGFAGKVLLLTFWSTSCVPCLYELETLRSIVSDHASHNLVVMSVCLDPADQQARVQEFVTRHDMTWTQAFPGKGFDSDLCKAFRVTTTPSAVVLDPQGKILMAGLTGRELATFLTGLFATKH